MGPNIKLAEISSISTTTTVMATANGAAPPSNILPLQENGIELPRHHGVRLKARIPNRHLRSPSATDEDQRNMDRGPAGSGVLGLKLRFNAHTKAAMRIYDIDPAAVA